MFCTKCGNKLEEGAKFCSKCSNPVNEININTSTINDKDNKNTILIIVAVILTVLLFVFIGCGLTLISVIWLIFLILDLICILKNKSNTHEVLTTDMEIYISQLEIKPRSNKKIKQIAKYLETIIMPNEEILAVAHSSSAFNSVYAIATNRRVILKSGITEWVTITPIEKVSNVTQSGSMIFINQTWINLLSVSLANRFMNLINNQVSSIQTVGETIKIENKIVTQETITSQLQKLSDLHKAKVLTDYEYNIKKQELLEKIK